MHWQFIFTGKQNVTNSKLRVWISNSMFYVEKDLILSNSCFLIEKYHYRSSCVLINWHFVTTSIFNNTPFSKWGPISDNSTLCLYTKYNNLLGVGSILNKIISYFVSLVNLITHIAIIHSDISFTIYLRRRLRDSNK